MPTETYYRRMTIRLMVWTLSLLLLIACDDSDPPPPGVHEKPSPAQQAVETELLPRIDLEGIEALIAESRGSGRVLVIDFWATWCAPCVENFPRFHEGVSGLGDRVRAVSITLDAPGNLESKAVKFLKHHHALEDAYLLVPDENRRLEVVNKIGNRWRNLVVPAILVYGVEGELADEFLGDSTDIGEIVDRVGQLARTRDLRPTEQVESPTRQ